MPQKPQRPFVPHRTPTHGRPAITASEFRLYTPFVPGVVRETVEVTVPVSSKTGTEAQSDASVLSPIEDFLDTSDVAPLAYDQGVDDLADVGDVDEEAYELPPVEHFIDSLPGVDEFASDAEPGATETPSAVGPTSNAPESDWGETDWQQYDWRAAASLAATANDEATNAWASTDWDGIVSRAREGRQTAAHAIAKALNEIAERIKAGELAVPGSGPTPDPTTIEATLVALLGVKR